VQINHSDVLFGRESPSYVVALSPTETKRQRSQRPRQAEVCRKRLPGTLTGSVMMCALTAARHLRSPDGVLVVDETGFLKKGARSGGRGAAAVLGHRRQDRELPAGCVLRVRHRKGRALIDRELYLPKSWIADRDRCREAAVPDDVGFATKTELARQMLARALEGGVPAAWVTADEAYGKDHEFRAWLEQRRIGYVVAVACNQAVPAGAGTSRADALAAHAPGQAWKRRSCGEGAKGPLIFDWAAASLPDPEDSIAPGWFRRLLARRSLTRTGKGEHELACYLCAAPTGTPDDDLIRVAGYRWAIEETSRPPRQKPG
jgi:SRSO17 transposase